MDVVFQVLAGWFVIDLITGLWHFFIDHRKPTDPIIGSMVADFQEHHLNPLSMEPYSFFYRNYQAATVSLLALVFACFFWPWFWLAVWIGGTICQQAHHWAHSPRPWPIAILQQLGILISKEAHLRHHRNFERSFGILNGWSHGFLDLLLGRIYP